MLLFERFYKDGRPPRRFFACSAARDRKDCPFFQWEGENVSEARNSAHREIVEASREPYKEACDMYKKIFDALNDVQRQRCLFCHSCSLLFVPKEKEKHQAHDYQHVGDISRPTGIMEPRDNEKTQAVSNNIEDQLNCTSYCVTRLYTVIFNLCLTAILFCKEVDTVFC